LVVLQVCVVVLSTGIEAMAGVYHGPHGSMGWQQRQLLGLVALTEVALTVGVAGSLLIAGRVRRQTFNLEPAVIARLYQHHLAMLHAVREGLIITDRDGLVVLANDEARRLLGLPADSEGRPLAELLTDAEWAADDGTVRDRLQVTAGRALVVSRSPAEVDGVRVGMVTTLRDRTELRQAMQELDAVRALAAALRAKSHESANRLQAIVGLVELGRYEEAVRLGTKEAEVAQRLSDGMLASVRDPALTALLLAKSALAEQRGIGLRLDIQGTAALPTEDVLTVVGNLLDNALDATAGTPGGRVELTLRTDEDGALHVVVSDNGHGIAVEPVDTIFTSGWTTKPSDDPAGRGLGLALVRHTVSRLGGSVTARNADAGGAVFHAVLPVDAAVTPAADQ
jgi:sensor histidine kinase regulating citrate/malate metabolism